jgi:hypothetical protein
MTDRQETLREAAQNRQIPDSAILKNTTMGEVRAALAAGPPALDVERVRDALTEIADWDAHNVDCATIDPLTGKITDKDCSCGWVEIADVAREALGLEPIGYPDAEYARLTREETP